MWSSSRWGRQWHRILNGQKTTPYFGSDWKPSIKSEYKSHGEEGRYHPSKEGWSTDFHLVLSILSIIVTKSCLISNKGENSDFWSEAACSCMLRSLFLSNLYCRSSCPVSPRCKASNSFFCISYCCPKFLFLLEKKYIKACLYIKKEKSVQLLATGAENQRNVFPLPIFPLQ